MDVRDMLCAQALALVAKAVEQVGDGEVLEIRYNAPDVRADLVVWARDRGYPMQTIGSAVLRIERRR